MSQKEKFQTYFKVSGYSELDEKEDELEAALQKARDKIVELQDQEHIDALILRSQQTFDKYFRFAFKWLEQQEKTKKINDTEDGIKKKQAIVKILKEIQSGIKDYIRTDLLIRHNLKIAKNFQEHEEESMEVVAHVEWTVDTQTFLEKYVKKVPKIKADIERFTQACELLHDLGSKLEKFEKQCLGLYGNAKGRELYNQFLSGLR